MTSGLKIAPLIVGLEVQNSKMPSNRKRTNFESIQRKKSMMLLNVIFCSNELQHLVGKQILLSITNEIIILSPNQPNAPRIWRNLDNKCTMTLLRRFWSFSQKIIKQIVHPIYRISQLNVLYRIVSKKLAQYTALIYIQSYILQRHELYITYRCYVHIKCLFCHEPLFNLYTCEINSEEQLLVYWTIVLNRCSFLLCSEGECLNVSTTLLNSCSPLNLIWVH